MISMTHLMATLGAPAIAVATTLAAALPATAGPVEECSVQFNSQIEIGNCVGAAEDAADAAMELALGFAMNAAAEIDDATGRSMAVPALEASQTAWIAYRDQQCAFVGTTFGGGSGTGIASHGCRVELARDRADALMEIVR